jgi:hypothetical protein
MLVFSESDNMMLVAGWNVVATTIHGNRSVQRFCVRLEKQMLESTVHIFEVTVTKEPIYSFVDSMMIMTGASLAVTTSFFAFVMDTKRIAVPV